MATTTHSPPSLGRAQDTIGHAHRLCTLCSASPSRLRAYCGQRLQPLSLDLQYVEGSGCSVKYQMNDKMDPYSASQAS